MAAKSWILFSVMLLLTNSGCAVKSNKDASTPAPFFKDPIIGMEMVYVEGGCYKMGDVFNYIGPEQNPGEKPVHKVCIDGFYIGKYEVTQEQWKAIMGSNTLHLHSLSGGDSSPVGNVSWTEVQDFISRLNSRSGEKKYRLPTEAEWEYAARSGGKKEVYSGGNDIDRVAWYDDNSESRLHPVGTLAPNGLGMYDMSGNAWEMVNDWYDGKYYTNSPRNNPTGPDKPTSPDVDHVVRGGSTTAGPGDQRTTKRSYMGGGDRSWSLGFRLVRTP